MAKQQTRNGGGKPITSHPLFPAVVALWFGALFGLGSLAIRASLLEELIIASRIDLIIPAAAPPLGLTARMLLALGLAAFGATIGAWIGRKLGEAKPEKRERRRDARAVEREQPRRTAPVYAAPSAQEADCDELDEPSLADERIQAQPSERPSAPALAGRRRALAVTDDNQAFELTEYAPLPGGAPQIFAVAEAGIAPIAATADLPAPAAAIEEPVAAIADPLPEPERQIFRPAPAAAAPEPEMAPVEVAEPAAQQANPVMAEPFAAAPVAQSAPFELPQPEPEWSYAPPVAITTPAAIPEMVESPALARLGSAPAQVSAFDQPAATPLFAARETMPEVAQAPEPAAVPVAVVAPPRAPLPPLPPLAPDAPLTDLAARLAEAMSRRRAAREALAAPEPAAPVTPTVMPVAEAVPAPVPAVEPGAIPAAMRPLVPEAVAADDEDLVLPSLLPPRLDPHRRAEVEASLKPADPVVVPAVPLDLPASMRPVDTASQDAAIDDELDALLPPRTLVVPPVEIASSAADDEDDNEDADQAQAGDERFSSLLAVAPRPEVSRGGFVRIEEPPVPAGSFEPVVIFPGHAAAQATAQPAPAPFARPFDPPLAAASNAPAAAGTRLPDPEETERALKLALASLQRMSGAA